MLHPDAIPPKTRKHLSLDPLIRQIRLRAKQLPETRDKADGKYSMADAVMSAIALFALKDPSLLFFQERRNDENIKNLFHVLNVPSDTQMRAILDPLEPDLLRPMFNDVFRQLQRGKALEPYTFHEGCYLVSWMARDTSRRKRFIASLVCKSRTARQARSLTIIRC